MWATFFFISLDLVEECSEEILIGNVDLCHEPYKRFTIVNYATRIVVYKHL